MIEELKAYTINKIKSMEVVAENCLTLLLISLRYNVKLEDAELFFKAHLPELLSKEEALLLDQEYVYSIFTDETLSYVNRQDLFLFLVKWVAHCPARNETFPGLMSALKLDYIRKECLNDINIDPLNDENKTLCYTLASKTRILENILIACQAFMDYHNDTLFLYAFNVDKKYWFQISMSESIFSEKAMIKNKVVLVYVKDNSNLCRFNLDTDEESQQTFKWLDELEKQITSTASCSDYTFISHMSQSAEKLYVVRESYFDERIVSTIYCNDKTDESNVYMKALIALKGGVVQFGVTDQLVCLIVSGTNQLTVYAADVGIISTVDLSQFSIDKDTVLSAVCGGKIYISTNTHLLQLNISKAGLALKTSVSEIVLEGGKNVSRHNCTNFEFTEDKIITVTKNNVNFKSTLSYAYQKLPEDINSEHKEENVVMDVPEELEHCQKVRFLEAYLPRDTPRCHDKCPHCSFQVRKDRKPISYGTKNMFSLDQYYNFGVLNDSDDDNSYDFSDDHNEWDTKNIYWDNSADELVENHW